MIRFVSTHRPSIRPPEWFEVCGFKSLGDPVRLTFRPLTLLAGANSSGKSSIMQPLLMMKQTLEASYDPGPLLLNGPHVRFTRVTDFLSHGIRKQDVAREVRVSLGPRTDSIPVRRSTKKEGTWRASSPLRLSFVPAQGVRAHGLSDVRLEQMVGEEWTELKAGMDAWVFAQAYADVNPQGADLIKKHASQTTIRASTERFVVTVEADTGMLAPVDEGIPTHWFHYPAQRHEEWLSSILHIPGLRGHGERVYQSARFAEKDGLTKTSGPFTPYVAGILAAWQDRKSTRLTEVNESMRALGLTWKVAAQRPNDTEVELRVGRMAASKRGGARDLVSIADVGIGVSQVLPVVVALAAAKPGQVVYIEQPELHLHPRAQLAVGRLLAQAAARGVFVIVETHSPLVLRAVQTEVAKADGLEAEDVALHWFDRDPKTGNSRATLAEVDERGTLGDWPIDFAEVDADADEDWMEEAFGGAAQ